MPRHSSSHNSKRLREKARNSILAKIKILEKWATDGIPWKCDDAGQELRDADGELVLDYYPTNPSSFCAWNGMKNSPYIRASLPEIYTNSRDTLRRDANTDLSNRLGRTLSDLKARAALQLESTNKTGEISKLQTEVEYWKTIAESLTSERIEVSESLAKERKTRIIREETQKRNESELQRQLQLLEDKNAALVQQLKQITPINDSE